MLNHQFKHPRSGPRAPLPALSSLNSDSPPYEGGVAAASADGVVLYDIYPDQIPNSALRIAIIPRMPLLPQLIIFGLLAAFANVLGGLVLLPTSLQKNYKRFLKYLLAIG